MLLNWYSWLMFPIIKFIANVICKIHSWLEGCKKNKPGRVLELAGGL